MPGEWVETTLGEVLTLARGFDLPETERKSGPYPVIASTGRVGTHTAAMVRGPGVVIGRSGSLGGGQFIRSDFWPLNTTLWVKDFKDNDPRFCYYLLRSLDLAHFNAGSGVPTLNRNHIHPLPVRVPADPCEQRAIAHILGALDDKIELNRRMNETLEAIARAIFKSWFVDFNPVRAKMDGRWRRGQSLPGLPANLYDLFPDRLVESELGEIPEGWESRPVVDFADLSGGKQLEKRIIFSEGEIPVFGGAGVMGYTENHNADGFVIAVGRVGAYCGQFFSHRGKAWINNNASLVRQRKECLGEWLFLSLRHADIDVIKKGAAQPFVSNGDIAKLPWQKRPAPYPSGWASAGSRPRRRRYDTNRGGASGWEPTSRAHPTFRAARIGVPELPLRDTAEQAEPVAQDGEPRRVADWGGLEASRSRQVVGDNRDFRTAR